MGKIDKHLGKFISATALWVSLFIRETQLNSEALRYKYFSMSNKSRVYKVNSSNSCQWSYLKRRNTKTQKPQVYNK